jgi:hypothetical protein
MANFSATSRFPVHVFPAIRTGLLPGVIQKAVLIKGFVQSAIERYKTGSRVNYTWSQKLVKHDCCGLRYTLMNTLQRKQGRGEYG